MCSAIGRFIGPRTPLQSRPPCPPPFLPNAAPKTSALQAELRAAPVAALSVVAENETSEHERVVDGVQAMGDTRRQKQNVFDRTDLWTKTFDTKARISRYSFASGRKLRPQRETVKKKKGHIDCPVAVSSRFRRVFASARLASVPCGMEVAPRVCLAGRASDKSAIKHGYAAAARIIGVMMPRRVGYNGLIVSYSSFFFSLLLCFERYGVRGGTREVTKVQMQRQQQQQQ